MTSSTTPSKDRLVRLLGLPGQKITYEQARDLLDHPDATVRSTLGARADVEPEILFFLASDPDAAVRRTVANNATARQRPASCWPPTRMPTYATTLPNASGASCRGSLAISKRKPGALSTRS